MRSERNDDDSSYSFPRIFDSIDLFTLVTEIQPSRVFLIAAYLSSRSIHLGFRRYDDADDHRVETRPIKIYPNSFCLNLLVTFEADNGVAVSPTSPMEKALATESNSKFEL